MQRDYTGLLLALVTASLAGCLPDFHPLEGRGCDATHACPDSLTCIAEICLSSSAADATLLVSDFEAGPVGWEAAFGGRLTALAASAHGGLQSLRISGSDGAAAPFGAQTGTTTLPVASGRYCATGFVLHGASGTSPLTLQLRAFGGAGGSALLTESSASAVGSIARLPTTGKAYQAVRAELEINSAVVSAVRLIVTSASAAPADFHIDDFKVIRTVNPCPAAN